MESQPAVSAIVVDEADVRAILEASLLGSRTRKRHPVLGHRSDGSLVVVTSRRFVRVGQRVPVPPEAQHPYVHPATAAYGWHVAPARTIHQPGALVREVRLHLRGQPVLQPDRSRGERHEPPLARQGRQQGRHDAIMAGPRWARSVN